MESRRKFIFKSSLVSAGIIVSGGFNQVMAKGMVTAKKSIESNSSRALPSYVELASSGELRNRWRKTWPRMSSCDICPRDCGENRIRGLKGTCGADAEVKIASYSPHFGEERELVGSNGSGTIFLSNCAMKCVFCINHQISQGGVGRNHTIREFADMMLAVQGMGCHNLNLVTPTQYLPHILRALEMAASEGLRIPIVYNTHGWEKAEMLALLDGVVDIYLPDFKYAEPAMGSIYSAGADNYPEITQKALLEMHRQVGVAIPDTESGLMQRGLMIRHLVMPNHVENSIKVIEWIAANLPADTYVNIMSQYTPHFRAGRHPEISRRITVAEYNQVVSAAKASGLTNCRIQGA